MEEKRKIEEKASKIDYPFVERKTKRQEATFLISQKPEAEEIELEMENAQLMDSKVVSFPVEM